MKRFKLLFLLFFVAFIFSCDISEIDQAENSNESSGGSRITIKDEIIMPKIIAESPINNSVVLTSIVTVTFNKSMNSETINNDTFIVTESENPIEGNVVYDTTTNTAIFTPTNPFEQGKTYIAEVISDVKDNEGNNLVDGNLSNPWSFTITTEIIVPDIIAIYPIINEINVSTCTPIVIVYNTVNVTVNVELIKTNCTPCMTQCTDCSTNCKVKGRLTQHGNSWIFIPSYNLEKGVKYTVIVTGTVSKTWNFTTAFNCGCAN